MHCNKKKKNKIVTANNSKLRSTTITIKLLQVSNGQQNIAKNTYAGKSKTGSVTTDEDSVQGRELRSRPGSSKAYQLIKYLPHN
jgi:hypothetical protein